MGILSVNVGSSSLKLALWPAGADSAEVRLHAKGVGQKTSLILENGEKVAERELPDQPAALAALLERLGSAPVEQVGHRLVHGGRRYAAPVRVDEQVFAALQEVVPLSPLHLPAELAVIRACGERLPGVPQVAVFDTHFHNNLPERAATYAVPQSWRETGVRRFGFHGIACADVVAQLGGLLRPRAVILHLGSGCSATAVRNGASVDTTMGFTPLEGLVMGTRCGDLDPGALLYMLREGGLSAAAADDDLNHRSGLAGLSGVSNDMEVLLARESSPQVALAIDVFVYRAAKAVAALAVPLGGLDQLIFSGGIGEHAASVRERIAASLQWLGMRLDASANRRHAAVITAAESAVEARVVTVDESRQIAAAVATWASS